MDDMLDRMVKRANDLLYNSLKEDGVTAVMGAELEFTLAPSGDALRERRVDPQNPMEMGDSASLIDLYMKDIPQLAKNLEKDLGISELQARNKASFLAGKEYDTDLHRPAVDSKKPEKAQGFEASPYVASTYKETGHLQYEVVISHEPTQFGDQTDDANDKKGRPAHTTLPRAIEGVKKAVTKHVQQSPDLAGVDFSAMGNFHITNGLHINVSLENEKGENLTTELIRGKKDQEFTRHMQQALLEVAGTTVQDEKGLKRISHMATSDILKLKDSSRFENRLPSANTPAGVAVMISLIAAKHAHDKVVKSEKPTAVEVSDGELWNITAEDLAAKFDKSEIMRDMLNELSDGEQLGDRIIKAFAKQLDDVAKAEKAGKQDAPRWGSQGGSQGWGR